MGPFLAKHIDQIEMVQQRAVRSISKLRGRERVTCEKESLGLELLQDAKVKLLLKILPSDTNSRLAETALHFYVTRSVTLYKPLERLQLLNQCILTAFYIKSQEI